MVTRLEFEYFKPASIDEAVSLLAKHMGKAKPIAGGTDLLVLTKTDKVNPECLVDISGLHEQAYIKSDGEGIKIGALTTIRDLETSTLLKEKGYILTEAAHQTGSVQVRNVATIGGNICHGAPYADMPPALIALEAKVKIVGSKGERVTPLEECFMDTKRTALKHDEILTEITIPNQPPRTGATFLKLGRLSVDIALVNAAVRISLGPNKDICENARIVMGAVAPTPIRARKAEALVSGKALAESLIKAAAQVAAGETKPLSDVRSSADYRREMCMVLVKHGLERALARAETGVV